MEPFVSICPKCGYVGKTGWTTVDNSKKTELWISCNGCGDKIVKYNERQKHKLKHNAYLGATGRGMTTNLIATLQRRLKQGFKNSS